MKNIEKILVTGANGFVGQVIVDKFSESRNFEVYGLGRTAINTDDKNLKKYYQADVGDYQTLKKIEEEKRIDVIIHSAGLAHQFGNTKREEFFRVNAEGTTNICRAAHNLGTRKIVLISSVSVYGNHGSEKINEEFVCQPVGYYAESKFEAEKRAIDFCSNNNIDLTILRLATVIGERDKGNTTRLITLLDKGRFFWVGTGNNKKSLIYKDDVAKGILRVIENQTEKKIGIYNLTGEPIAMKDIVEVICRRLGKKVPRMSVSENLLRSFFRLNEKTISLKIFGKYETTFNKWLSDDIFSGQKFLEDYGYSPQTPIAEALSRQVEDYLKNSK